MKLHKLTYMYMYFGNLDFFLTQWYIFIHVLKSLGFINYIHKYIIYIYTSVQLFINFLSEFSIVCQILEISIQWFNCCFTCCLNWTFSHTLALIFSFIPWHLLRALDTRTPVTNLSCKVLRRLSFPLNSPHCNALF